MAKKEPQQRDRGRGRDVQGTPLELDVEQNRGYGDERYEERDERCERLDEGPAPEEGARRGPRAKAARRPRDEAAREQRGGDRR
jgi:hypothetical protein